MTNYIFQMHLRILFSGYVTFCHTVTKWSFMNSTRLNFGDIFISELSKRYSEYHNSQLILTSANISLFIYTE